MNKKIKTYLLITLAFLVMLSIFIIVFTNKETIKHITISQLRNDDEEIENNNEDELSVKYDVYNADDLSNVKFLIKVTSNNSLEYIKQSNDFKIYCNNKKSVAYDYSAPRNSKITLYIKEANKEEVEKSFIVEFINYVKSITLDKTSLSIDRGDTETIIATVGPNTADDKSVTWSSSDSSIASVNENGVVTALAEGTATITATAKDGSGIKATCSVTVNEKDYIIYTNGKLYTNNIGNLNSTTFRITYWGGDSAAPQITTTPNLKIYEPGSSNPQGTAIGSKAIDLTNYRTLSFNVTNISWRKSNATIYVGFTNKYGTGYSVAASNHIFYPTTTTGKYTCDVSGLKGNYYFIVAMSSQGSITFSDIRLLE